MALIETIHGQMDESLLEHKETVFEDDNELTKASEYWYKGELVHRSVHVHLKKGVVFGAEATNLV